MNRRILFAASATLLAAVLGVSRAAAQDPIVTPIVAAEAAPIIVKTLKPAPKNTGLVKFEGYVMHANIAQITVRADGNDMAIRTFTLSENVSAKMQQIVDKGGYQYGDKVKIFYDPQTLKVIKLKGKPSKSL